LPAARYWGGAGQRGVTRDHSRRRPGRTLTLVISTAKHGYLGPAGTFTEAALIAAFHERPQDVVPYETVPAALDAVRRGEVDSAMVPFENSVEGSVNATLDELSAGSPLIIVREVVLPVTFALLARPGIRLEDVRRVTTHPHAEAQTRQWMAEHLPEARVYPAASTAAAAAQVADEVSPYDAAIAAPVAVAHYRLEILAEGIGDNPDAATRFVLVSRPTPPPPPTGADRTSLVAFIRDDHPGALIEILEEFAVRGVNLTRLESRPTGDGMGRYCFSIDCEGHVGDARVGEALMGLRRVCADVRFLGSYARADGVAPTLRLGTSDKDFEDAEEWLRDLRTGRAPG
jgi:prephenate dehydratase